MSAVNPFCLWILHRRSRPHSVSNYYIKDTSSATFGSFSSLESITLKLYIITISNLLQGKRSVYARALSTEKNSTTGLPGSRMPPSVCQIFVDFVILGIPSVLSRFLLPHSAQNVSL